MSCKLEPLIWSCDTCFDRCQLIITWMSNIEEVHSKPILHISVNPLFGVWPPCCATPPSPPSCIRTYEQYRYHDNHEKINSWVSFCFPYEYGAPLGGRSSAIKQVCVSFLSKIVNLVACKKLAPGSCYQMRCLTDLEAALLLARSYMYSLNKIFNMVDDNTL